MDQPAPAVPPIVVTPPRTNRLLFFLIGILILASGIGIGLVVGKYLYSPIPTPTPIVSASPTPIPVVFTYPTPSSDTTSDWKTYINKKNLYSVEIPSGWEPERSKNGVQI